ncbi:PREDICTED: probable prolyl 4-hydroxylase 11 [Camelina sativa]|uniref:Probable prolyl 4-hydroxylase 11 n=1 Tax=Camelina sativa TaxID=90675 RepID=A0ABM0V5F5_CAMSA|nr:PREDICTED: probable prolyl 4-hydroxylase 11 [Camelina sativa]
MSKSTSQSTELYLRHRLKGLKIHETSDLLQHVKTFEELVGDNLVSVDLKIEDKNKDMILLCSLPPLLTALTCNQNNVTTSLRFPHERWIEIISKEPRAFVYHNFLKNEECEHLISLAKPSMAKSKVHDKITGLGKESSARTSSGTFLRREQDNIVKKIEERISEFTFIPVENGEPLQVIHYGVGQKFEPHFDGFQRIATVLMYLSDVEEGGETVFPAAKGNISKKGLSVRPKKGDALLFWSMRPDGSQDPSSQHGGSPVIKGNKWASTKWFRFHEFKNNIFSF